MLSRIRRPISASIHNFESSIRRTRIACGHDIRNRPRLRQRRLLSSISTILVGSLSLLSQPVLSWTPPSGSFFIGTQRHAPLLLGRRYSTKTKSEGESSTPTESSAAASLMEKIREAYEDQETDGILALAQRDPSLLLDTHPQELIRASVEATQGGPRSRAAAAGVINAWIGACSLLQQDSEDDSLVKKGATVAESLWVELEEQEDNDGKIAPDIVTYCLAYHAIHPVDPSYAQSILEKGLQVSKKQAGSKRRKALAAARRRGSSNESANRKQLEVSLQEVLEDDGIRVLFDTDDYIVVGKPSGVTCYHSMTTTAGKISNKKRNKNSDKKTKQRDISLEDALLHCQVPLSTLNADCQGLVHRLDRGTSGCMIWSKTNEMHAHLVTAFFLRQVKKQYTTLVTPTPTCFEPANPTIQVDSTVQGHAARSEVTMLESFGTTAALLQVEPSTGRRHQVRVHCAEGLDTPVLLDPLYSKKDDECSSFPFLPPGLASQVASTAASSSSSKKSRRKQSSPSQAAPDEQRFFLHASSLIIPSMDIHVQAPLPLWWEETLENLKRLSTTK